MQPRKNEVNAGGLPNGVDQLALSDITTHSTLADADIATQNNCILDAYNEGNKQDITVESRFFGKRIDQDEFRLVHRNNVPQLVPYTYYPRRLGIYLTGSIHEIGVYKQTDLVIGDHGRYLVNVPQGKLVKAWLGTNKPIFLGEGPHVIKHPNFKLADNAVVDVSEPYISHGNYKVLRVPRGKVAKVWIGSTPYILESRKEPYIFDDPTFRIESTQNRNNVEYFTSASEPLIEHGSIKRILPRTGEVAIAYDSGNLKIIKATGKPFVVNSDTFTVDGFLQTAAKTLVFPSKKTQEERRRQHQTEYANYEEFRTNDGLPIGVKLLVVFEIIDPNVALTRLRKDDIINHIENIVVADMGRVIQTCSSSDFQKSNQTAVKDPTKSYESDVDHTKQTFYAQLQDTVKNQLAADLVEWGIRLVRLNIETPKILDPVIADAMAKNSLGAAKARAEAATLGLDYTIKQQRATQDAEQMRIKMDRERENKIVKAEGDAKAATMTAQAQLERTKLETEADRLKYENDVRRKQMEVDVDVGRQKSEIDNQVGFLERQAKLFTEHPELLQLQLAKAQAEALRGIGTTVVSPEVAAQWFGQRMGLFAPAGGQRQQQAANDVAVTTEAVVPAALSSVRQ